MKIVNRLLFALVLAAAAGTLTALMMFEELASRSHRHYL